MCKLLRTFQTFRSELFRYFTPNYFSQSNQPHIHLILMKVLQKWTISSILGRAFGTFGLGINRGQFNMPKACPYNLGITTPSV